MSNDVTPPDDQDQDSEPTMMAPAEGRPDGVDPAVGEPDEGLHAQDGPDQSGAEEQPAI